MFIFAFSLSACALASGSPPAAPSAHRLTVELWGPRRDGPKPFAPWLDLCVRSRAGEGKIVHIQKVSVQGAPLIHSHYPGRPHGVRYDVLGTLRESELSKLGRIADSLPRDRYRSPEQWMDAYTSEIWGMGIFEPHRDYLKGTQWNTARKRGKGRKNIWGGASRKERKMKKIHKKIVEGSAEEHAGPSGSPALAAFLLPTS